jgi:hypothetical protein
MPPGAGAGIYLRSSCIHPVAAKKKNMLQETPKYPWVLRFHVWREAPDALDITFPLDGNHIAK